MSTGWDTPAANAAERSHPTRRALLGGLAGSVAAVGAGAGAVAVGSRGRSPDATGGAVSGADVAAKRTTAFHGPHQPGIADPPPPFAAWVAFDLPAGTTRESLRRLLRIWTDDIARLMDGTGPLTDLEPELAAVPAGLAVTVALGPGAFKAAGLASEQPSWLRPLPAFEVDRLEEARSGGDVLLQLGASSPTAVAHAQRRLITAAGRLVTVRWVQRGFREPFATEGSGVPMRTLFGQVDGTVNLSTDGSDDHLLWIGDDGPRGLVGGTSMVVRRIAMNLDGWDRVDRASRENAVGRRLDNGAPLTGRRADDPMDLEAVDRLGFPVIDTFAHVRRAMPQQPHERFLRRPYNYDDEPAAGGRSNSGLMFVTFQADPVRQFLPVQRRLAEADLLNLWTTPTGSGVYAVLPGVEGSGSFLGEALLG